MNTPIRAVKSQKAISTMAMLETNGLDIKMRRVIIMPKDIPSAKLDSKMVMF